jgi:tetratricopeptide (TPR) repeat protein
MDEEVQKIEVAAKRSWGEIMAWIGGITALVGFIATISGGVNWFRNHRLQSSEYKARIALAQTQTNQKQYQAALRTYGGILKEDPLDRSALDAQLDTAMLWVENFSVFVREGKDEGDISAPALDEIFPVLTSGLTRAKGTRAADVQAHLGWAHFLDQKIAHREDESVAVDDWRAALSADPTNVYANAMLGNWMLQTGGGNLAESVQHFHTALATGRALAFVRTLQVGGLLYLGKPGARAEIMKVANEMRSRSEPLDQGSRHRISSWLFGPSVANRPELLEALTAVSSDDTWRTYLWLTGNSVDPAQGIQDLNQKFIHANLLELSGNHDGALDEYRQFKQGLRNQPGSLRDEVEAAIRRLHHD